MRGGYAPSSLYAPSSQWNWEPEFEEWRNWNDIAPCSDVMAPQSKAAGVELTISERATDWWLAAVEDVGY